MSAITMTYKRSNPSPLPWALLLLVPIVLLLAVPKNKVPVPRPEDVVVSEISHAETQHGADALAVRSCLKERGARQVWQMGNRYYFVCGFSDGRWGLQIAATIDGKLQEITAYIRENTKTIEQMANYLRNGGAKCIKGALPWVK